MSRIPLVVLLLFTAAPPLGAAEMKAGDFDPRFGDQTLRLGLVEPPLAPEYSDALAFSAAVAVDAEGRQLLLTRAFAEDNGAGAILVQRFVNGALDESFAGGGAIVVTAQEGESFMLSAGEGLEVGTDAIWLAYSVLTEDTGTNQTVTGTVVRRFNLDGIPMSDFGDNGVLVLPPVPADGRAPAVLTAIVGDRLVVARIAHDGAPHIEVMRFLTTGVDDSFNVFHHDGLQSPHALETNAAGDLLLEIKGDLGESTYLRLKPNGMLDDTFHDDGIAGFQELLDSVPGWQAYEPWFSQPHDMMLDEEGRVLIVGAACCAIADTLVSDHLFVARFNMDGTADITYGTTGSGWYNDTASRNLISVRAAYSPQNGVVLHAQDTQGQQFAQRHYLDHTGRLDARFGTLGIQLNDPVPTAHDMLFNADGSVLIAGGWGEIGSTSTRAALTRYLGRDEMLAVEKQVVPFAFADRERIDRFDFVVTETKQLPEAPETAAAQLLYITGGEIRVNGRYRFGNRFGGVSGQPSDRHAGYFPPGASFSVTTRAIASAGEAHTVSIEVGDFETAFDVVTKDDVLDSFEIPFVENAEPGAIVVSETITVSGIDVPVPIWADLSDGGEISLNGSNFSDESITVRNGDTLRFRVVASTIPGGLAVARFYWGSTTEPVETALVVTTRFDDAEPEPIVFPREEGVALSAFVTSLPATIGGDGIPISISNGCYFLFDNMSGIPAELLPERCVTTEAMAGNSQVIVVGHVSAATGNTETETILRYGELETSFVSVTEPGPEPDTDADAITFESVDDIALDSFVASEPAAISGINAPMAVSVTHGCYFIFASLDDVPETPAQAECRTDAGAAYNGQAIVVAHTSAGVPAAEVTTILHYGSATTSFTSMTAATSPQPEPGEQGGGPVSIWGLAILGLLGWRRRKR